MREIRGKVALVTGAASGIGRETALALAREGARLIICDVNESALAIVREELASISECLLAERVDVSNFDQMQAFADRVHDFVPCVDILVNNAGVAVMGDTLTTTMEDWRWIVSINLWGPIHGCHLFVPEMVRNAKGGHVVNVSSMLGFTPTPYIVGYTTTKFGVLGMSLCMRTDLRMYKIGVSVVCPGFINTNIIKDTRIRGISDKEKARELVQRACARRNYGPDRVARAIVRAVKRNQAIVPITIESKFAYYLNRLWPAAARALFTFSADRFKGDITLEPPPTRSRGQ